MTEARDIHIARIEADVRQCWLAFRELRPHLQSEDEFVERWRKQTGEGYQVAYVKDGDKVVAAAGYRFLNTMAWGIFSTLTISEPCKLLIGRVWAHGYCSICRTRQETEVATPYTWPVKPLGNLQP